MVERAHLNAQTREKVQELISHNETELIGMFLP